MPRLAISFDVDLLEPRRLLSGAVGTLETFTTPPAGPTIAIPLKKKAEKSPEIALYTGRRSLIDGASAVDFGQIVRSGTPPTRTFAIFNSGRGTLTVGAVSLPAGFTLIDAPAGRVSAGKGTTFTVRMETGVVATRSGKLSFTTNDSDERTFDVTLTGRVTAPPTPQPPASNPPTPAAPPRAAVYLVRPERSAIRLTDGNTAPVEFEPATVGQNPSTRTFRVANEGGGTITLGQLTLPAGFTLVEGLSASLAPGQVDEFTVALSTSTAGSRGGQVRLTTSDPAIGAFDFAIAGTVSAAPAPAPTPTTPPPPPPSGGTAVLAGDTLTVTGTAGADSIVLSGKSAALVVTINGRQIGGPFAGVGKIVVRGGDGNDSISAAALYLNGTFDGGLGDDTIDGTQADDVLIGGAGHDLLRGHDGYDNLLGGDGNDTLVGGAGIDSLQGDAGDDTLDAIDGIADARVDGGTGNNTLRRDRIDPG
ncbi:MAG TPA: choice-of-anchor D domain-containing protein [Tepidisphaeraceae bacterium]|nr:choice-of-anchor D domain-containing protein [Tepidisphaeraceae bacterium]